MEELLPVGSIVSLKDKRVLVIIGYSPNTALSEKQYDYIATPIIGITKIQEELRYNRDYFYFNKKDIEAVLFIGYSNEEFDLYKVVSEELSDRIREAKSEKEKLSEEEIKKICENYINEIKAQGSDKNEK